MKVYNCRLCNGKLSEPKLDLGSTPLANEFVKEPVEQDLFPLQVCVCENCEHYQLNEQVDPERMFRNYLYVAGTSPVNVEHFRKYAVDMVERFELGPDDKVLDIASNDGVLLNHFKKLGMDVLGIDPARNLAEEATKNGIPTIPEFFNEAQAEKILKEYGKFDLITANNVFAHSPDLIGMTKGVQKLLKPNGIFTFEISYLDDVIEKNLFDTIYHEHTSYHTIGPLKRFFFSHNMYLFDVEKISNHGGSIRCFVRLKDYFYFDSRYPLLLQIMPYEEYKIKENIKKLQKDIEFLGYKLREKLQELKSQNKSIAIYGVPAKATTLMYALNIDETLIDFAVDDAPLKISTYTPGKHIPVLAPSAIYEKKPDVLLVLGWNFAESIIQKHSQFNGQWIIPLPELKIIDSAKL